MPQVKGDDPSSVVVVVVPARNEERRLDACLRGLTAAIRWLRVSDEVLPVRVLVLDRCTDRTAAVAAGWPSVEVVVTERGRVGAARAAGVRYTVAAAEQDVDATWSANTDADSVVAPDWLGGSGNPLR